MAELKVLWWTVPQGSEEIVPIYEGDPITQISHAFDSREDAEDFLAWYQNRPEKKIKQLETQIGTLSAALKEKEQALNHLAYMDDKHQQEAKAELAALREENERLKAQIPNERLLSRLMGLEDGMSVSDSIEAENDELKAQLAAIQKPVTDEEIKHMVNRFLAWKLPENFNPDGGVSFKKMRNENTVWLSKNEPVGTNLLDATQTEEMVRYMLEGLARLGSPSTQK